MSVSQLPAAGEAASSPDFQATSVRKDLWQREGGTREPFLREANFRELFFFLSFFPYLVF